MNDNLDRFWGLQAADVLRRLDAHPRGLASAEASARLDRFGPNVLQLGRRAVEVVLTTANFGNMFGGVARDPGPDALHLSARVPVSGRC